VELPTCSAALQVWVDAELANIVMYERFFAFENPADVKAAFAPMLFASKNHMSRGDEIDDT
jgi:hypothetical protein